MIGRWTSAAGVFNLSKNLKSILGVILPFVAFGIFLLVNWIAGNNLAVFYPYLGIVVLLIIADKLSQGNPVKQLILYSFLNFLERLLNFISLLTIFSSQINHSFLTIKIKIFPFLHFIK